MPLTESSLLAMPSDLIGNNLDEVRLTVHSVHFSAFEPVPDLTGFKYIADITWSFYGTPIPEPGMIAFVISYIVLKGIDLRRWKSI